MKEAVEEMIESSSYRNSIPGQGSEVDTNPHVPEVLTLDQIQLLGRELVGRLDTKMESLLEAKLDENCWRSHYGKLDRHQIHRMGVKDSKIFHRQDEVDGINTALVLVGDVSGSMNDFIGNQKLSICQAATLYAVGETLQRFDVPFAIMQFSDKAYLNVDFGDWAKSKGKVQPLSIAGTNTANAMVKAVEMLALREEDRKMILLVTDGLPRSIEEVAAAVNEAKDFIS